MCNSLRRVKSAADGTAVGVGVVAVLAAAVAADASAVRVEEEDVMALDEEGFEAVDRTHTHTQTHYLSNIIHLHC